MKFVVVLIILVVGGLLLYQKTVGITLDLLDDCHVQATQQLQVNDQSVRTTCTHNKSVLTQLSMCLESVQQEKFFAGLLYELSGAKEKVTILVKSHNQLCPNNEVPFPTAELYLQ